jgi:hypothetical protein
VELLVLVVVFFFNKGANPLSACFITLLNSTNRLEVDISILSSYAKIKKYSNNNADNTYEYLVVEKRFNNYLV